MKMDYSKIFPPGEKDNKPSRRSDYASGVMPGFYTGVFFVGPVLFYYYVLREALIYFAEPKIVEVANNVSIGFFFLAALLGIFSDWKQPFNVNSNKQKREGTLLRSFALIIMLIYVLVIVGVGYFAMTHPIEASTFWDSL
jgi:hypothetical protein